VCLACGEPIEETLWWVGSLRCLECRDIHRPLDPSLAKAPDKTAGPFMTPTALLALLRARVSGRHAG
jgi:hypothetical protein